MSESDVILLYITSDDCPSCDDVRPIIQKIAKELNLKFIEKNLDKEPAYRQIIYKYGLIFQGDEENSFVYPVPQVLLINDEGIHYVLDPEGGSPELIEQIAKKRIKLLLEKKIHWGRTFLHQDLRDFTDPEHKYTGYDFYYLAKQDMPRIKIFNKIFAIDLERFIKLVNKNFMCLCVKGQKCPCKATKLVGKCVCGVFYRVPSTLGVTNDKFKIKIDENTELEIDPRKLEKFLERDTRTINKKEFLKYFNKK